MNHQIEKTNQPRLIRDDEIDLIELFHKIWGRKWWVAGTTILALLVAVAYLWVTKPVYQAGISISTPRSADIAQLQITPNQVFSELLASNRVFSELITPNQVFSELLNQMRSNQAVEGFVEFMASSDSLSDVDEGQLRGYLRSLKVNVPRKNKSIFTRVTIEGHSGAQAAVVLNTFVEYVRHSVIEQFREDFLAVRDQEVNLLLGQVDAMRAAAVQSRQDLILRLEEALRVADALGIHRVGSSGGNAQAGQWVAVISDQTPYLRGTAALSEEIRVLKERPSDDPYIDGLRELQAQLEILRKNDVDLAKVVPVQIDRPASEPMTPVRPKSVLVLALSIVLGGMLGILLSLVIPGPRLTESRPE